MGILTKSRYLIMAILLWWLCSSTIQKNTQSITLVNRKNTKGENYTLLYANALKLRLTTQRPNPADTRIRLAVAAAYTNISLMQPLDLLVANGRVLSTQAKVGFLDAVVILTDQKVAIHKIPKGSHPPDSLFTYTRNHKGSLFLQELLVYKGKVQKPEGGSRFQRRALAEFTNQSYAIVESTSDYLTMKQFAEDLRTMGVRTAVYLDMGDWDEGWYKTNQNQPIIFGHRRTRTKDQSNWLIFHKSR